MSLVRVTVEERIGWLIFDRPNKLNAFSLEMLADFELALDGLMRDESVSVIIVRGEGRAFSVGYDVGRYAAGAPQGDRVRALDDWLNLRQKIDLWLKVWRCPKPVIAAVHGYCLGGATMLAVCCDLTIVARDAVIGWPNVPLGGGLLGPVSAWLVGPKKAKELSYIVGSEMSGQEAVEWGWANHAVEAGDVVGKSEELALRIAKTPVQLLQVKKRALNRVMDMQGFSEIVMFGAEFDAIAHDSAACDAIRDDIRENGLKATIRRFSRDPCPARSEELSRPAHPRMRSAGEMGGVVLPDDRDTAAEIVTGQPSLEE